MVSIQSTSVVIGGHTFNLNKADYPSRPTAMSGVDITWGAGSCIEHTEPTRATLNLWIPYSFQNWLPALGDAVTITANLSGTASLFVGKAETVTARDDHSKGYRVKVVAGDVISETAKLRLADKPWPYETGQSRYYRTRDLLQASNVSFVEPTSPQYLDLFNLKVTPRDVDAFNALEAVQRLAMAAGTVVNATGGKLKFADPLKLPVVLLKADSQSSIKYAWTGTTENSRSIQTTAGVEKRRNYISNPNAAVNYNGYSYDAGTGGTTSLFLQGQTFLPGTGLEARRGSNYTQLWWQTGSTGGAGGVKVTESISGTSGDKFSGGLWLRHNKAGMSLSVTVTFLNGSTAVGTKSASYSTSYLGWYFYKIDGATATGPYNSVRIDALIQGAITTGTTQHVDGVLLEKSATAGDFFDGNTLDAATDVRTGEVPNADGSALPVIPASAIEDDAFQLDHANTVNQIKVEYFATSEVLPNTAPAFSDATLSLVNPESAKQVPQQRSLQSDFAWNQQNGTQPSGVLFSRARVLLAAQSIPKWRLASTVSIVLKELDSQPGLRLLLDESTRFGQLIKITGVPMIDQYQRVRGGRIVLGTEPVLELEIEPVDYSAPLSLTRSSLIADPVASTYNLRNFKTLTPNDLRSIGAR